MCGIVGTLVFGGVATGEAQIRDAMALMARRGPDDEGIWSDGRACILGFRRLAILDLTPAGRQPMLTADGRYDAGAQRRDYNFRELRRELSSTATDPLRGDAEVALHALAHWGIGALDRFNGMFALGFLRYRRAEAPAARDHPGVKPLYYLQAPRAVLRLAVRSDSAASWAEAAALDPERLSLYLHWGTSRLPSRRSAERSIEDGAWLTIEADGSLQRAATSTSPIPEADWQEPKRMRRSTRAVGGGAAAAGERVPVGVFLSGGIDSPLVAPSSGTPRPTARLHDRHRRGRARRVTGCRTYATELRLPHTVRQLTPDAAFAMLDDVVALRRAAGRLLAVPHHGGLPARPRTGESGAERRRRRRFVLGLRGADAATLAAGPAPLASDVAVGARAAAGSPVRRAPAGPHSASLSRRPPICRRRWPCTTVFPPCRAGPPTAPLEP